MKHLKNIKEYDDLEDCLQEVFDKFSISKADSLSEGNDKFLINGKLFYCFNEKFIGWTRQDNKIPGMQIIIGRDDDRESLPAGWSAYKKVIPDIKKEIERIKPMIEKRIRARIKIDYCPNHDFMYIEVLEKKNKWWQILK